MNMVISYYVKRNTIVPSGEVGNYYYYYLFYLLLFNYISVWKKKKKIKGYY